MPQTPSHATARGRFLLTLDGTVCGFVTSAEGGDISAPVIREPVGALVRKRLGAPSPEPIVLSFDLSLDKVVYDWIAEFWKGAPAAKSGSVISLDQKNQATSELVFEHAAITATTLPEMDSASKTPSLLTVRLNPAATKRRQASGTVGGIAPKPSNPWLASNFRLEVDGLDATRVSKIDPLLVAAGEEGVIDFPDLRVLLSEATAETWSAWHHEFVVEEKNDDSNEKSGSVVFLAPNLKAQLGRVALHGLGIHRLAPQPAPDRGAAQIGRLAAELYCESMELAVS